MPPPPSMLDTLLEPLQRYAEQPNAVELQVNRQGEIWVETTTDGMTPIEDDRLDLDYFHRLGRILSNDLRIIDFDRKPYLACTLPGGHRMQLCLGGTIKSKIAMSIRLWTPRRFKLEDYVLSDDELAHAIHKPIFQETDPQDFVEVLKTAVKHKLNVVFCGGMFSAKTSITNAALEYIPSTERVISVEDAPELDLSHIPNRVEFVVNRLETEELVTHKDVLMAISRLRPDRIFVGEYNVDNTWTLARLLNMGHGGSVGTIHAENTELAFEAMTVNIEANGVPISAAEKILRRNIHVVLQVQKLHGSYKRGVTEIWLNPNMRA